MNTFYALMLTFCLQGDDCLSEEFARFETLPDCMVAAKLMEVESPDAETIYCDNLEFSSGDSE